MLFGETLEVARGNKKPRKKSVADVFAMTQTLVRLLATGGRNYSEMYIECKNSEDGKDTKLWDIPYKRFLVYLHAAKKSIAEQVRDKTEYYVNRGIYRYDDIYKSALDKGDLKVCIQAQEKLENLLGLTTKKISVETGTNIAVGLNSETIEKARQLLNEINGNTNGKLL